MSSSLRHRGSAASVGRVSALDAADELREQHESANRLFRRIFVGLSLALCCARFVLAVYGLVSATSFPHHAEASMTLGGRLLTALEVWGAASLLVCAVHFVRPMNRAVYAVMAINAAVTLAICLFGGEAGWLQVSKEKSFFFFLVGGVCVGIFLAFS